MDARQPETGIRSAEPHANVARPGYRRHHRQRVEYDPARDWPVLDQLRRHDKPDLARRWIVSVAERAIGMAPPLSLQRRRYAAQAGNRRQVGAAPAARYRRSHRLDLFLGDRA